MLAVTLSIPAEWLVLLTVATPVVIYLWKRRASQACTVTESRILAEKSVKNVEEQWTKLDDVKDRIGKIDSRLARIEGAREAEQRHRGNPKIVP